MYLAIDIHTGLIYEGYGAPTIPSVPTPHVAQAKLIQCAEDWQALPTGLASMPTAWLFREDSFDPVTRTRRGRLYEAQPGQGQPNPQRVEPHPYEDPLMRTVSRDRRVAKQAYTYTACVPLLNMRNQGQGLTLAVGSDRAASAWRIIQTEVSASRCVVVTLKALSAFAILPDVDDARIDAAHRPTVHTAIQRVLDSAFRESPTSVVDHCRAALTVLLSRWLVQNGHDESALSLDLGALANKIDEAPYRKACPGRVAQVVARLHARGKPNEQHAKGVRPPTEGDDEFALQAVALVLRDFGWAAC